jgi:hypothetical protein
MKFTFDTILKKSANRTSATTSKTGKCFDRICFFTRDKGLLIRLLYYKVNDFLSFEVEYGYEEEA